MSSPRFLFGVTSVAVIIDGGVLLSGSAASAVPVSDITVGASPDRSKPPRQLHVSHGIQCIVIVRGTIRGCP